MKQLIMDVLEDMSNDQINLASKTARETIATVIISAIRASDKGWYLDLDHSEEREKEDKKILESHKTEEWKVKEFWVCSICGKNTYAVDWDYIGSGTNHLGCELELNIKMKHSDDPREHPINTYFTADVKDKRETNDRRKSNRREKNWSQKKHEDKVFGNDEHREYPYNSFVRNKEEVDKLAEEIVSDNDTGYIYESPDGGKTVYKRKDGSDKRELVKDWKKINVRT
jgi:hypothetical protein